MDFRFEIDASSDEESKSSSDEEENKKLNVNDEDDGIFDRDIKKLYDEEKAVHPDSNIVVCAIYM